MTIDQLPYLAPTPGGSFAHSENGASYKAFLKDLFLITHPVGSLFFTADNVSPATTYGGTWTQIRGHYIFAADEDHPAGTTGGEAEHTITVDEMPAHGHRLKGQFGATGTTSHPPWTQDYTQLAGMNSTEFVLNGESVEQTGGGQPMPIEPLYAAYYVWQRTA